MKGQRKHTRVIKRLETEFSAGGAVSRGISRDLSRHGLFVKTMRPFSRHTVVDLTIHLPDTGVTRLRGTVRWTVLTPIPGRGGMGIQVIESDQAYRDFLNTILPPEERFPGEPEEIATETTQPAAPAPSNCSVLGAGSVPLKKKALQTEDDVIDSLLANLISRKKPGH